MSALTARRGILGTVAALAAVPAIAAPVLTVSPDAALLTAYAEHIRLAQEERRLLLVMRSFDASDQSPPAEAAEAAWDAACDRTYAALEVVVGMQAATMEGAAAKARCVMTYLRSIENPGETDDTRNYDEVAARSVLRDLERMAGGAL